MHMSPMMSAGFAAVTSTSAAYSAHNSTQETPGELLADLLALELCHTTRLN
jgi:hypothetical protein